MWWGSRTSVKAEDLLSEAEAVLMASQGTDDVISNHHGFSVICVKACSPRYLCVVTVLISAENMAAADLQVLLNPQRWSQSHQKRQVDHFRNRWEYYSD